MPPGDPNTRRGVTFHEAHVPRAFLSPARGLEGSRAGCKAGVSFCRRLMAKLRQHKSEKNGPRLIAGLNPRAG